MAVSLASLASKDWFDLTRFESHWASPLGDVPQQGQFSLRCHQICRPKFGPMNLQ